MRAAECQVMDIFNDMKSKAQGGINDGVHTPSQTCTHMDVERQWPFWSTGSLNYQR